MSADAAAAPLEDRFDLVSETVPLPRGAVRLDKPRNPDVLISESDFAKDDRLPYWADLWPAAISLATFLETAPAVAREGPSRAIELGCGLGLVTIAAMRAGHEIVATDYYADALEFAARNAARATGRSPVVRHVDWRTLPTDLGRYDLVLAADVLYERIYGPLVASVVARLLAPGGRALIADQGRVAVGSFLESCGTEGLGTREVVREQHAGIVGGVGNSTAPHTITIFEVTHA